VNKIEYRTPELKQKMQASFGPDFEQYVQTALQKYTIDGYTLVVCPLLAKNGKPVFGQLPLWCEGLVSRTAYKRIWLSCHYSRKDIMLALHHEVAHILNPELSEEDIAHIEKEVGETI